MKNSPSPKPPAHLTPKAKKLWNAIFDDIELDAAALLLLNTLAEQFDRYNEARAILKTEGVIVTDRFGQKKQHPACLLERDAATGMMRAWRLLGFDQVPPAAIGG